MAKAKKAKRRMRKAVRKTLGTLFLISSLIVAAIPVENLKADTGASTAAISVGADESVIPDVSGNEIYTSGDGMFQFAYVKYGNTNAYVAVIVKYTNIGALPNSTLEIPNTIDAYRRYKEKDDYVAVNPKGEHMFYCVMVGEEGAEEAEYRPCYYVKRDEWIEEDTLYYYDESSDTYIKATVGRERLADIPVSYIGNQYVTADSTGSWTVNDITSPEQGIFSGESNIKYLTFGDNMMGIGTGAFYGCTGLESVELANGLQSLGDYVFAECRSLSTVNIAADAPIDTIGAYAFNNCVVLSSFYVPNSVTTIGDSAFAGCRLMSSIDMSGGKGRIGGMLTTLGTSVFKDCAALKVVEFPRAFAQSNVDLSIFSGCASLQCISSTNSSFALVGNEMSYESFKTMVQNNGFYFQGLEGSALHIISKGGENPTQDSITFAFSYLDSIDFELKDIYEMTVHTSEGSPVFRVNSSNQLISSDIPSGMTKVELPEQIGPYAIATIGTNTFDKAKCTLKQVIIPSSVTTIATNAFKGCHELEYVIFASPCNVTSIGAEAFKTQSTTCSCDLGTSTSDDMTKLRFVGPVSSDYEPFNFAMNANNNYNNGAQEITYIEYYSGWPQNIVVQYDADTEKATLIDYPTFSDYLTGSTGFGDYVSYPEGYAELAASAVSKYKASSSSTYLENEKKIVDAVVNIEIPEGVEAIKEGLFAEKEANEITDATVEKTITAYGLKTVEAESFSGCKNLVQISLLGDTTYIGDYAFKECENLQKVYLPASLTEMGKRPFVGCTSLLVQDGVEPVQFDGDNFECVESIIFQNTSNGGREVVEYLEGRKSNSVDASEMSGVTAIAEEAFRGTNVGSVDLTSSSITVVPSYAFADTQSLYSVLLPDTCVAISEYAFYNSTIDLLRIPESVVSIHTNAFVDVDDLSELTFKCVTGSNAYEYAKANGISTTAMDATIYYTVTFRDWDGTKLAEAETVLAGNAATPPDETPTREGYTFTGWFPDYTCIQESGSIYAQYELIDTSLPTYTVTFINWDDTTWSSQTVTEGEDAIIPQSPTKDGYTFTGWRPAVTNVTKDIITYAQFELNTSSSGSDTDGDSSSDGSGSGSSSSDGSNSGSSGSSSSDGTSSGSSSDTTTDTDTNKTLYTLTVVNGSGSGSYVEGAQPIIIANDPPTGKVFDSWTIDPSDTTIASKNLTATVITMPDENVTVTANYKTSSSSSSTASGNNSSSSSSSSSSSTNKGSGSNTVIIDKNGLSNTGVVNVTVNGSSDNFTVKINESASATEAIIKALKAEYGDISNIKYFPMDITLYDSTGKTKITDTTGLSISITLPLPDSLITYAGNNKVAGVVDEKLDKLKPRFTTIDGVSCITFTCEHFSPYVIYVDTENLSSGTVSDSTPKTGDGIHPKWFLSIGLALIAVVLFMKKDQQPAVRRVRA